DSEFSTEAHQRAIDALQPGSALLVVKRGPNAGSRFLLDQDVTTAGRHPDSDIFLDDVTVSRRHVEFRRDGAGFAVYDVGSLNGTYVNRERIDSAVLSGGDEVQIGRSEEHTSELQSLAYLVCRLLLEKKNNQTYISIIH